MNPHREPDAEPLFTEGGFAVLGLEGVIGIEPDLRPEREVADRGGEGLLRRRPRGGLFRRTGQRAEEREDNQQCFHFMA
jgi:hypothetical protein